MNQRGNGWSMSWLGVELLIPKSLKNEEGNKGQGGGEWRGLIPFHAWTFGTLRCLSIKLTRLGLNYFRVTYEPFEQVTILLFIKLKHCLLPIGQDEIRYRGWAVKVGYYTYPV